MRWLISMTVLLSVVGCASKPVNVPDGWAATVVKAPDPVPPQCARTHRVSVPTSVDGEAMARYTDRVLNEYATLKGDYQGCATWARRQRP